jgi:hypothetical protein
MGPRDFYLLGIWPAGVQAPVVSGKIAAGDLEPNSMLAGKGPACHAGIDMDLVGNVAADKYGRGK